MTESNTATVAEARAWLRENTTLEVGTRGSLSAEQRKAYTDATEKQIEGKQS